MFNLWNYKIYRKWMYRKIESSVIYEIVRKPGIRSPIKLYGPLDNNSIKYAAPKSRNGREYCQVVNGEIISFFYKHELLFLKKAI